MPNFRGIKSIDRSTVAFEAGMLPDEEKERLCRALLAEFGVTSVDVRPNGEMIHSCCLPNGAHRNGDANPSASLNYKKLVYSCFSCGSSGGFLWFIATCRGEDTGDSLRWLADQTGSGPDEQSLSSLIEFFDAVYSGDSRYRPPPIPRMNPAILEPWLAMHPYMFDPVEEGGRGVPEDTLEHFQVGFAPEFRLKIKAPPGQEHHADRHGRVEVLSPRIVIPHFWQGDLIGWQTRRMIDDGTPKYQSSPDFAKDRTLYNFDETRPEAVIVESPLSVLRHFHHVPHLEATFGAKVTDRQASLVSIHRKVVLWLDNDDAGWGATTRMGEALTPYCDTWAVDNPWDADPADLPDDEVQRLLTECITPYALWQKPDTMWCWRCKDVAHQGACQNE